MIDKKEFKQSIGKFFREEGFLGKGQSWYLSGDAAIVVIGAQKSDYDEKYYLNVGVWLKALGANEFPKEHHCHIQSRLESLFPDYMESIETACSLDRGSSEKLVELVGFLRSELVPFCRRCLNVDDLKDLLSSGRFSRGLVMKVARDVLEQ